MYPEKRGRLTLEHFFEIYQYSYHDVEKPGTNKILICVISVQLPIISQNSTSANHQDGLRLEF